MLRMRGVSLVLLNVLWLAAQNVGIGTATPQGKLHVYESATRAWIILDGNGQDADLSPRSYGNDVRAGVSCFRARGTKASPLPVQNDDILGFIGGRGYGDNQFGIYSDAAVVFRAEGTFTNTSHPSGITLETTPDGATLRQRTVHISSAGRVGIGLPAPPAYQLELSLDDAAKPSTNTWTVSSDSRLKSIVGPYTKGLSELMQLRPVRYYYKNPEGDSIFVPEVLKKENVGFIAQEVATVFPEAVDTAANGYLGLNIHAILIAYLNAIQELKAENDRLRSLVMQMQAHQKELEASVEELRRVVKEIQLERVSSEIDSRSKGQYRTEIPK